MAMTTDGSLLKQYVEQGCEQAFRDVVTRHIDVVHSVAARIVNGDAQLAKDVTQTVFVDLARKARRLPNNVVLGGWLYRHTCFVAAQAVRTERRRKAREQKAVEMSSQNESTGSAWDEVAPFLNEAIQQLPVSDRDAVILRYFNQYDLRTVGTSLGTTEEAARKRITRALDRLRDLLTRRGKTLSTAALASMLSQQAVSSAPAGLAAIVAGPAIAAGATVCGLAMNLLGIMTTKLKLGAIGAVLAVGVATPVLIQYQALSREREQKLAAVSAMATLQEITGSLSNRLELESQRLSLEQDQKQELMRLRDRVGSLRNVTNDLSQQISTLRQTKQTATQNLSSEPSVQAGRTFEVNQYFPAEGWIDAGFQSHAAAVQTFLWAGHSANAQRLMDAMQIPEPQRKQVEARWKEVGFNSFPFSGAKGVKVFAVEESPPNAPISETISDGAKRVVSGKANYICDFNWGDGQPGRRIHFEVEQVGNDWKLRGNSQVEDLPTPGQSDSRK